MFVLRQFSFLFQIQTSSVPVIWLELGLQFPASEYFEDTILDMLNTSRNALLFQICLSSVNKKPVICLLLRRFSYFSGNNSKSSLYQNFSSHY